MKNIFITTLLFLTVVFCSAQEKYVPSQENLTNREWFRDANSVCLSTGGYTVCWLTANGC